VERLKRDGAFDVKKVPVGELSDELKKMTPEQREKHVRELLSKREGLQKQIAELAKKREAYLEEERRKAPDSADKALDEALRGALREQAKKKGIDIPAPPPRSRGRRVRPGARAPTRPRPPAPPHSLPSA